MAGVLKARVGGTWIPIGSGSAGTGTGDVVGPGSAVDGNIALYDGTTGKLIKDGNVSISSLLIHAPKHYNGGADPVDIKQLAGYPGGTTAYLRADATFFTPPAVVISTTHAARPNPATVAPYTILFESDRTVWYIQIGGVWKWTSGQYVAAFADIPTDLTANDTGFICDVAFYSHKLWWGGADWSWAPAEIGSGFFMESPYTQDVNRWAYCDGHTTTLLMLNPLREQSFLTPDLVNIGAYKKTGPVYGLAGQDFSGLNVYVNPAGAHTHPGSYTDSSGGHSHTATTDSQGSHTHGGTTGDSLSETQGVLGGVSIGHAKPGVPGEPEIWYQHKHAINLHGHAIGADGAHGHNISMNIMGAHTHWVTGASDGNHTHTTSISGDLNLRRVELLPWLRR